MINKEQKAKLMWRCRRGMLELDLLLEKFVESNFSLLTNQQIISFFKLLECTDPELFSWFMEATNPQDTELLEIVNLIREYHKV